jgi:small nuclear ribonucleoprotein (snRNP)-like protein
MTQLPPMNSIPDRSDVSARMSQQIFNADYLNVQPLELIDRSVGKQILVLTQFGYEIRGILKGFDAQVNCVLQDAEETKPTAPDFAPRQHRIILVNGSTISIVFLTS